MMEDDNDEVVDLLDWSVKYDEPQYYSKPFECEFPQCYKMITAYFYCNKCSRALCIECAENHPDLCIKPGSPGGALRLSE
jgi:hypothetical protein